MMNNADIDQINKVLESMLQYELNMSDLYSQCADTWKNDRAFWQTLAHAETKHAENVHKMREMITQKQDRFELGRPFNPTALNTAMSGLKDNVKRLASGSLPMEKMLIMARDIEQSVLESHYAEIVKTADIEYQTLMKGILSDTYQHKQMIQRKIDALTGKV